MFFSATLKMFPWIFSDPMQFLSWAPSPWRRGWSLTASRKSCWRGVGKDGVDVGLGNPKCEALSVTKLSVDIMFQVVIFKDFGFWPPLGKCSNFPQAHLFFKRLDLFPGSRPEYEAATELHALAGGEENGGCFFFGVCFLWYVRYIYEKWGLFWKVGFFKDWRGIEWNWLMESQF